MKFLSVLIIIFSLSGCIVVPEPAPVYVRPAAVVVTPAYVAPPVATAVIVTRPVQRRVIITRY